MATADLLLELMSSWIDQREGCARQLKKLADELESLREKCNAGECVGNSVSVVGAACLLGAGAATLFTGGAAAPFLGLLGGVYTGVGVTVSVVSKLTEHFVSSDTMKEAEKIEAKSNDIAQRIQKQFDQLKAEIKKVSPSADPDEVDRGVMTELLGAMARRSGLKMEIDVSILHDMLQRSAYQGMNMQLNQSSMIIMINVFVGILAFFAFRSSGKGSKLLIAEGTKQMIKQMSTTGVKTAFKGGAMVVGGAVGLAFALPEAVDSWKEAIKKNHVTEASQSLRDTADTILKMTRKLREQFDSMREMLQKLARVKCCIENRDRTYEDQNKLMEFAMEQCQDPDVKNWLRENVFSVEFFYLVDMFNYVKKELDKKKKKMDCGEIDIIFVAHGGIDGFMMSARTLLPLPTIKDVLLYSPWNCLINGGVAYGIATGSIRPWHRMFVCAQRGCSVPSNGHQPLRSTSGWNSMRAAAGLIPKISVSPITSSEDGAWKSFEFLQAQHGQPERNRIVIPFIVPGAISLKIPFFVVTLALALVLFFSRYRATVHLAACLGRDKNTFFGPEILEQYTYTIDNTLMKTSQETQNRHRPVQSHEKSVG
ncbi:hypothetical protein D5F01_LYC18051 [Larimichthys crocea]|uniref:Apolipoprotein L3 n=1 Tax=Larimichthys crocea TaxID=215358 RepID=A0A6G0HTZ1_LARCR|nr:hypothetical protein D5F01_LYC18051 [Larimichthys crocea]